MDSLSVMTNPADAHARTLVLSEEIGTPRTSSSGPGTETGEAAPGETRVTRILLVEDDAADAYILHKFIHDEGGDAFVVERVEVLTDGLRRLALGSFDVVLLDLGLPDSRGIATFRNITREMPEVPVIVLSGLDDEQVAVAAVREGAQDYLVKGKVDGQLLVRSIRYAIERHHMQVELRSLSLTDDLTGLSNRRGFMTLAEQQIKLARRAGAAISLVFGDLDNLKQINDSLGHDVGDQALVETAEILHDCFRESDILARLGGDEFVALLVDTGGNTIIDPRQRIQEGVARLNDRPDRPFTLSLSLGLAAWELGKESSLEEMIRQADRAMYEDKRRKKGLD